MNIAFILQPHGRNVLPHNCPNLALGLTHDEHDVLQEGSTYRSFRGRARGVNLWRYLWGLLTYRPMFYSPGWTVLSEDETMAL